MARRKDGGEPYKLAGLSSAAYKNTLKKFLWEDSRKLREKTAKHSWELVLGNLPKEKEKEETMGNSVREHQTEEEEVSGEDRCGEALKSQKKARASIVETRKEDEEQTGTDDTPTREEENREKEEERRGRDKDRGMYQQEEGGELEKIKVERDKKRRMNFGPHPEKTYGEVLREEPEYAKALIKENRRDNQKSRLAHWVMAYIVQTFFSREEERETRREKTEEEDSVEARYVARLEAGRVIQRRRTSAERESEKRGGRTGYRLRSVISPFAPSMWRFR